MISDVWMLRDTSIDAEAEAELSNGLEQGEDASEVRAETESRDAVLMSAEDPYISKLCSYTAISPNKSVRTEKISKITIHHMACVISVERCGEIFAPTSRQASSNYGVGGDGRIACYAPENFRAWTTSSKANDNVAVTIEVANSVAAEPWPVSDTAYESLIRLCVDICQRNGIKRLNWTGDKSGNLTVHRWFAATNCPGAYLLERMPSIAAETNKRLANGSIYPVAENPQETSQKPAESGKLTYEEFCSYMDRYMSEAVVSQPSSWAKDACEKAIAKGVMKGDGKGAYNFQRPLTREAYLAMQDRAGLL